MLSTSRRRYTFSACSSSPSRFTSASARRSASSLCRRASTLANMPATRRMHCSISGGHCRCRRVVAKVAAPTIRRATESGIATIDLMSKRCTLARSTPSGRPSGLDRHTSSPAPSFPDIHGKLSFADAPAGSAGTPGRHQLWVSRRSPSSPSWNKMLRSRSSASAMRRCASWMAASTSSGGKSMKRIDRSATRRSKSSRSARSERSAIAERSAIEGTAKSARPVRIGLKPMPTGGSELSRRRRPEISASMVSRCMRMDIG